MTKNHLAAWECDWIINNPHHYRNGPHRESVMRNIIARTSFHHGALMRDTSLFTIHKDEQSHAQHEIVVGVPSHYRLGRRIRVIAKDKPKVTGFLLMCYTQEISGILNTAADIAGGISCDVMLSLEKAIEGSDFSKDTLFNKLVQQIVQEEVGENALYILEKTQWGDILSVVHAIKNNVVVYRFLN